jgi:hypothetical protein
MTFPHDWAAVEPESPPDPRVAALAHVPDAVLVATLIHRGKWARLGANTLIRRTK